MAMLTLAVSLRPLRMLAIAGPAVFAMVAQVVALSVPSALSAQTNATNTRLYGFKVGIATSSTRPVDPDLPAGESVVGLTAGVFGRIPFGRRISGQGEISFLRQGTDLGELNLRVTSIRLPVTIQYLIPASTVDLRIYGGLSFDLTIGCAPDDLTVQSGISQSFSECPISESDLLSGLVGGALVDIPLGKSFLTLDLRYDHGLTNLEGRTFSLFLGSLEFSDLRGFRGFEVTLGVGIPPGA